MNFKCRNKTEQFLDILIVKELKLSFYKHLKNVLQKTIFIHFTYISEGSDPHIVLAITSLCLAGLYLVYESRVGHETIKNTFIFEIRLCKNILQEYKLVPRN